MLSPSLPWRFGLVGVENAAALRRGHADHEIDPLFGGQIAPQHLHVAIVPWRYAEARAVVDPVVIEEDAKDLVSALDRGDGETVGRIGRLVRVGSFVDENPEPQDAFSSLPGSRSRNVSPTRRVAQAQK